MSLVCNHLHAPKMRATDVDWTQVKSRIRAPKVKAETWIWLVAVILNPPLAILGAWWGLRALGALKSLQHGLSQGSSWILWKKVAKSATVCAQGATFSQRPLDSVEKCGKAEPVHKGQSHV